MDGCCEAFDMYCEPDLLTSRFATTQVGYHLSVSFVRHTAPYACAVGQDVVQISGHDVTFIGEVLFH